jgi:NAD(P)-dependent dehydrogenase (short-subunit alcohol dehydrogenase family)
MIELNGRVALVTGGGSGIGEGICRVLAGQGAVVAVADLDLKAAEAVAGSIVGTGGLSRAFQVDVTKRDSVAALIEAVVAARGRIDILVNNAGVVGAPGWEERDRPDDRDWDLTHAVNLRGVVNVSEAVAEHMKGRREGRIINIASIAGRQGGAQNPPYSVSKAGVISWTQGHAEELAPYGINVNAICPGSLWTPLYERLIHRSVRLGYIPPLEPGETAADSFRKRVESRTPLKRPQTPEDVGKLTAFLASDDARNITGQAINLDGGTRMN